MLAVQVRIRPIMLLFLHSAFIFPSWKIRIRHVAPRK